MTNAALFASGNGTNALNLLQTVEDGQLDLNFSILICDQKEAKVIERVKAYPIDILIISPNDYADKQAFEEKIEGYLKANDIELLILAGYMRIFSEEFTKKYPKQIINIHPSLLPKHPGKSGIEDAYNDNVYESGISIHYVDAGIDTGEIIDQYSVSIEDNWTLEDLEEAIHGLEYKYYPKVLQKLVSKHGKED